MCDCVVFKYKVYLIIEKKSCLKFGILSFFLQSLQTQSNENCEIEECSMETIRYVQPVESDTETIESDGEIDECHSKDDLEWDVLELEAEETDNDDDGEMLSDETSSRNTIRYSELCCIYILSYFYMHS